MKKKIKAPKKAGELISKMNDKKMKKGKKNWIAGAIKKPGALHAELGIKKGNKIPAGTLKRAAGKGGKLGQRARLAETLKGMKHKKEGMTMCKMCKAKHMKGKHMKKNAK